MGLHGKVLVAGWATTSNNFPHVQESQCQPAPLLAKAESINDGRKISVITYLRRKNTIYWAEVTAEKS